MNCAWGWNSLYHFGGPLFWTILVAALLLVVWKTISAKAVKTTGTLACYQCGEQVEYTFMRCPHCGVQLKKHCPECSRIVDKEWKYCPTCSISLEGNLQHK